MKAKDSRILRKRKEKLSKRLERRQWSAQSKPMFRAQNIHYEMADRVRGVDCGALGAFHQMARNTGLICAIDKELHLLKRHLPYHESDHVLNIAYNTLAGGTCLDDIELRRNDETYMDALAADRLHRAGFLATIGAPDRRDYGQTQLILYSESTKGTGIGYLQRMFNVPDSQVFHEPSDSSEFGIRLIVGADYQTCPHP